MKRKKILALCLAAVLCLSACAKTPDAPIVVQKNQERLVEQAQSEGENRQSLQEVHEEKTKDYSFQFRSPDGKISISAEADVLLPEVDRIPMYHASSTGFSQEQVTAIYNYLFNGEETWYAEDDWYYTKAMADADLAEAREILARMEADTQVDDPLAEERRKSRIDHCKSIIEEREANYDRYPDLIVKIPADSTLRTDYYGSVTGTHAYKCLGISSDSGKRLTCHSFIDSDNANSSIYYKSGTGEGYSDNPTQAEMNKSVPYSTDVPVSCSYSYEEAQALAEGLFQAAGVEVRLVQTELLQRYYEESHLFSGPLEYDEEYTAYRFCYSRVVDGIPVAATTNGTLYLEDTNPTWLYERIYVTVDSGGISNLYWGWPVARGDIVNEDVQILSFDEAARIFEEMAPLIYQGKNAARDDEAPLTVDRVELNLMRVRDGGGLTGLYVPAWVFYGTEDYGTEAFTGERMLSQSPWIILAVNAVDGSIIDVIAGY